MKIVLHSFEGRYSDSPRALYEALPAGHDVTWLVDPRYADGFPAGTDGVTWGTDSCIEALEAADLVIANTHTDVPWTKKPGATYLQTWHGTPLKRIHWDVLWAPEGRLERLSEDVAQWDVLLSPNAASTPRLRGAFRYEGEVLEAGYPRNDVLSAPDREAHRARVRAELGIPDGTRAVLYAPTWRDSVVFAGNEDAIDLALDVPAFCDRLGDDHVLLLRLHYMLTGRLRAVDHPAVRDVSYHPDISELYLAADVLVTDYSSVMFDFAVLDRPIVLFAYDLDDYRDRERGFYFELEPGTAPGPIVTASGELLDTLAGLDDVAARHADAYAAFRRTYCHLEDGGATRRVLARLGL